MLNDLNAMLKEGYTRRMAMVYLDTLEKEKCAGVFDHEYMVWAHSKGFFAESASAYQLNELNYKYYLSDYDYYKAWPLNAWQRIWINDKLTLKYMLANTEFSQYMPEYYHYTTGDKLVPLIDNKIAKGIQYSEFIEVLKSKGEIACKPCNGTTAQGFHRLSFCNDEFFIDLKRSMKQDVINFIKNHPNYIFTENLYPAEVFARIHSLIHTLRVLVINPSSIAPKIAAAYLRFGVKKNGEENFANYNLYRTKDDLNFFVNVDTETGVYENGKAIYVNRVVDMPCHPDSLVRVSGKISCWNECKKMIIGIANRLGPVEYMGFDIGITENGPKIMEINSHSGIKYLQLYRPFYKDNFMHDYFAQKLKEIDHMSENEKSTRNLILR